MSIYRASSPIFDVPEFPALRRVKPLPKRRRTDVGAHHAEPDAYHPSYPYAGAGAYTAAHYAAAAEAYAAAGAGVRPGDGEEEQDPDVAALGAATELLLAVHHHQHRQNTTAPMSTTTTALTADTEAANVHHHSDTDTLNVNASTDATVDTLAMNMNVNAILAAGLEGLQLPGPDATAEELLKHAETLSTRMALQSYYMPLLGDGGTGTANTKPPPALSPELAAHFVAAYQSAAGAGGGRDEDHVDRDRDRDRDRDDDGDGDYIDHLQQPGNTKKRKVPSAMSARFPSAHWPVHDSAGPADDSDDAPHAHHNTSVSPQSQGGGGGGAPQHEVAEIYQPPPARLRRGRLTAATLAGLQHKEMLRTRKRQLAAVLGALSHGDTLALDQALSASYPFNGLGGGEGGEGRKLRLSRRRNVRIQRAVRRMPRHPDQAPFPVCEFSFLCHSATADRLIATKEEVAMLRKRFEAELARQAAKAAKMASSNSNSRLIAASSAPSPTRSSPAKGPGHGRGKAARAGKSKHAHAGRAEGEGPAEFLDPATGMVVTQPPGIGSGTGTGGGGAGVAQGQGQGQAQAQGKSGKAAKKKKRSAMANASNPHHLRNYVPSRLPHHSSPADANANNSNLLSPLPLRFLSADIPPRRRGSGGGKKSGGSVQAVGSLTNPSEEWICAFCEYALFYGDEEGSYRRAVRNRKKILRRRRRARERAAAAASGAANSTLKGAPPPQQQEYETGYEPGVGGAGAEDDVGGAPVKRARERSGVRAGAEGGYG
ncbi:hypothetical protein LshimejAT787_1301880 [Lyophyllum shimeji]|uniref:Uncharacterized protein n=1 Tax=Lyophyllum shimeji TaxID=47721 RepID=A0A9P3USJ9_LYOSH|nr:hypothetical protein LshimejAT787_1301880 [Lyophyllum shimeji]